MATALRRKLETAFILNYLKNATYTHSALSNVTFYASGEVTDQAFRFAEVYLAGARRTEGFEAIDDREFTGTISIAIPIQPEALTIDQAQDILEAVEEMMQNEGRVKTAMNKPAGTDSRPVKGVYLYSCQHSGNEENSTPDNRLVQYQTTFEIMFRDDDGDGPDPDLDP